MTNECIFCKIIQGKIPTDFLYKDDDLVAFRDINPQAPVHVLVVPIKHIPTINVLAEEDLPLIGKLVAAARDIAKNEKISKSGYKLIFNVEKGGGQEIFHIHLHLVGGWK